MRWKQQILQNLMINRRIIWFNKPSTKVERNWTSVTHLYSVLRGGADKSLARLTPRCRRTESTVSLERGVRSCAELQVFSRYRGWKEACQATCAISTTRRRELSSSPPSLQGTAPKEIHAILIETLGELAPSYATVKNWVAQFKRGDFSTPLVLDDPKQWPPRRLLIKFTS